MSLPSTERFQYFIDKHPLEQAFLNFKSNFDGAELNNAPLPLFIVFGIEPEDQARLVRQLLLLLLLLCLRNVFICLQREQEEYQ